MVCRNTETCLETSGAATVDLFCETIFAKHHRWCLTEFLSPSGIKCLNHLLKNRCFKFFLKVCSTVSDVNFGQVNAGWESNRLTFGLLPLKEKRLFAIQPCLLKCKSFSHYRRICPQVLEQTVFGLRQKSVGTWSFPEAK